MKRLTSTLLLLLLTIAVSGQDFKLYYAKNVTDVTQFRDISILDAELNWREVNNGDIDGNQTDVEQLKHMLAFDPLAPSLDIVSNIDDNTATSIAEMVTMRYVDNEKWYDLQGRHIANGQKPKGKGLYIVNGKKVVIK